MYAADLTTKAIEIAKLRLKAYGAEAKLSLQNAEKMTYADKKFDHVNCHEQFIIPPIPLQL